MGAAAGLLLTTPQRSTPTTCGSAAAAAKCVGDSLAMTLKPYVVHAGIGAVLGLLAAATLVWALRGRPAPARRESIPERTRHEVWRRDQARCVECGSRERLEFDHIIPLSRGGSSTARNLELRCERCNRCKGARI